MILEFFRRSISFGIDEKMDEASADRVRRINIFNLIFGVIVLLKLVISLILSNKPEIIFSGIVLTCLILLQVILPLIKKRELRSTASLILAAVFLFIGYILPGGPDKNIILSFYLLFPIAASTLNNRNGIIVTAILGLVTIIYQLLPVENKEIIQGLLSFILFIVVFYLVALISFVIERNNLQVVGKLKDSKSQYEREIAQKDQFMSGLSHKLRTSLSNITLINNLVHDNRLSSEQIELLDTLKDSTNELVEEVNNIVEVATPGLIDFKQSIISFNLKSVVNELRQILKSDTTFYDRLTINYTDSVNYHVIGDPGFLKTILLFLLKGVGSFLDDKGTVALSITKDYQDTNKIRLGFRIDIVSSGSERLYEHYVLLNKGDDYSASNITNAYHLINLADNKLEAEINGNQIGLLFYQDFTIDFLKTPFDGDTTSQETEELTSQKIELSDARVLLVEDNEINQKIVLLSLRNVVHSIEVANNGKEALDNYDKGHYDIILMDIMMPVMDGIAATKKIREIESNSNSRIPIIAITANALLGDRDNCLAAGVDDYISKPFQVDVLINKMKNLLA